MASAFSRYAKRVHSTKDREAWLTARRSGIGGSDAPAVLGIKGSALEVYYSKVDPSNGESDYDEYAYWGRVLEPIVAREFTSRTGQEHRPFPYLLRSREWPWMLATIDFIVHTGRAFIGLECKCRANWVSDKWRDEPPPDVVAQVDHYMAVTGAPAWWVAVLVGGNVFRTFYVERSDARINNLVEKTRALWECVKEGRPPAAASDSDSALLNALYPYHQEKSAVIDGTLAATAVAYLRTPDRQLLSSFQSDDQAIAVVKQAMGEAEVATIGGQPVAFWRTREKTRVNLKSLRDEFPAQVARHTRVETSRVFQVSRRGEEAPPDGDEP